jgi:hypothetical protein
MTASVLVVFRALTRRSLVTLAVIFTIAVSIAINTALFSIFDGVLFRPLPYPDADRIVHLQINPEARRALSRADRERLEDAMRETPLLEARGLAQRTTLIEEGALDARTWDLRPAEVTPSFFDLLGVRATHGRIFSEEDPAGTPVTAAYAFDGSLTLRGEDAESGWPSTVAISEDLWRTRFGSDPTLIGRPIEIPGIFFGRRPVLVGILPSDVALPLGANVWVLSSSDRRMFNYAKLAPGVTVQQLASTLPGVDVSPLRDHIRPSGAWSLSIIFAATGLLLIVTWVQLAGMLFAQAIGRHNEAGIRLALGAKPSHLTRQFALEAAIIAAVGFGIAMALAPVLTVGVARVLPRELVLGQSVSPDVRAMLFAGVLCAAAAMLLTLLPMAMLRRTNVVDLLRYKSEARRGAPAVLAWAAMASQIAGTTALLYIAGLSFHSYARLNAVDLGFDPSHVTGLRVPPLTSGGATSAERRANMDRAVRQLQHVRDAIDGVPGVRAVAGGCLPLLDTVSCMTTPRVVTLTNGEEVRARISYVGPRYAELMRLRRLAGAIPKREELGGELVKLIVDQSFARQTGGEPDAVGRHLTLDRRPAVIAAVIEDLAHTSIERHSVPLVLALTTRPQANLVVKLDPARGDAIPAIRAMFRREFPASHTRETIVLDDLIAAQLAESRGRTVLLAAIGLLCLPIAAAGLAGSVALAVRRRGREIAVRMAFGASPGQVGWLVAGRVLTIAGASIAAGLLVGYLVAVAMSRYLFGVTPADTLTAAATVVILMATAWSTTRVAISRMLAQDSMQLLREP